MTASGGWRERTFGQAAKLRPAARPVRSLGAALREAGLGDAAPEPRAEDRTRTSIAAQLASALSATRTPRLGVFDGDGDEEQQHEAAEARPVRPAATAHTSSVVSPPPWLRAARRGRWQARVANTFGWVMALAVAGTIIGLASHVLGVAPIGVETSMQARQ
ncbi:MAG: hypothetical protein AB7S70_05270 [Hyphomicrobium sp.]|uniref:hypothetical protein n=1 Tax=Hyphomicrobium sp. TaxID=82 RepID=UPI003D0B4A13